MIDVLGPEKRRRRTTQEKIAIVQQSFEPGMTVSPCCPATRCGSQPVISLAQAIPGREVLLLWPQENRSFLPLNLLPP